MGQGKRVGVIPNVTAVCLKIQVSVVMTILCCGRGTGVLGSADAGQGPVWPALSNREATQETRASSKNM